MINMKSLYIEDGVTSVWYLSVHAPETEGLVYTTFKGTITEAERRKDEIEKQLRRRIAGSLSAYQFSSAAVHVHVYSETDWCPFSRPGAKVVLYSKMNVEGINFYTFD